MFGPDLEDNVKKGIIPRMAENLFEKMEKETQDLEYNFQVSMMEIYRENLLDLFREEKTDLKIKESVKIKKLKHCILYLINFNSFFSLREEFMFLVYLGTQLPVLKIYQN